MFPRCICLQVSKRVPDEADRGRMLTLCNELRAEALPAKAILQNAGLKVVRFGDLTEEDAKYPHIAAMRSTMAKVDHWAHDLIARLQQVNTPSMRNCWALMGRDAEGGASPRMNHIPCLR
jgi:hypothetical protein